MDSISEKLAVWSVLNKKIWKQIISVHNRYLIQPVTLDFSKALSQRAQTKTLTKVIHHVKYHIPRAHHARKENKVTQDAGVIDEPEANHKTCFRTSTFAHTSADALSSCPLVCLLTHPLLPASAL